MRRFTASSRPNGALRLARTFAFIEIVLNHVDKPNRVANQREALNNSRFAVDCGETRIDDVSGQTLVFSMPMRVAKFTIGQVVKHRVYPFRGVIFDVDPAFANPEEWWLSIPAEVRPSKDQPFYRLYAENADSQYIAYVSEQNLLPDDSGEPVRHPQINEMLERTADGRYRMREKWLAS